MANKTKELPNGKLHQSQTHIYISLVVISILTLIVLVPSIFEYLRINSLEFIILIRKEYSHKQVDTVMDMLSAMGDKYGIFLSVCFALAVLNTNNYLLLCNVSAVGVAVNILVKMIIRDARPYFYSPDYKPVSCDFEYGSPSGHAQSVTSFYLSFLTLIMSQYGIVNKKKLLYVLGYLYCFFM